MDVMTHLGRYYKLIAYPGKDGQAVPEKQMVPELDAPEGCFDKVGYDRRLKALFVQFFKEAGLPEKVATREEFPDFDEADLNEPTDWWSECERMEMVAGMRYALEHPREAAAALVMSCEPKCCLPLLTSARLGAIMDEMHQHHHPEESPEEILSVEQMLRSWLE